MTQGEEPNLGRGIALISPCGLAEFRTPSPAIDVGDYLRDRLSGSSGSDIAGRRRTGLIAGAICAAFALGWIARANQSLILNVDHAAAHLVSGLDTSTTRKVSRPKTAESEVRPAVSSRAVPVRAKLASSELPVDFSVKAESRPIPVADTRPTSIEGWTVRYVQGSTAVIEGPGGVFTAGRGDIVPGVGRIDSIVLWGGRYIVATTQGLITTP
jgi:hypothetical protein